MMITNRRISACSEAYDDLRRTHQQKDRQTDRQTSTEIAITSLAYSAYSTYMHSYNSFVWLRSLRVRQKSRPVLRY